MGKGKAKRRKVVTGVDISNLSKARPTRIPQTKVEAEISEDPIRFKLITLHIGIILAVVLAAYGNCLLGQFVFQDSYIHEVLKSRITGDNFWLELFLKATAMPLMQSWLITSFALDFQSFALEPVWYHLVNIVLHLASCAYFYFLVFFIARRTSKYEGLEKLTYEIPLFASALLGCHPLAAESVAHITGREGVLTAANVFLSLVFFLFGFWSHTSGKMIVAYIASLCFFLMGIWSGPEAIAVPFLALSTIFLLRPHTLILGEWVKQTWPEMVLLVLLILSTFILPVLGVGADFTNDLGVPRLPGPLYFASQLKALVVYYLRAFVAPVGLSVMPPFVIANSWLDPFVILGAALVLLTIFAIYKLRNQALPSFGLALFLSTWLVNSLIVQTEIVADRRFYLPLSGLSLVLAFYLSCYTEGKRRLKLALPAAICLSLIGMTVWRNFAWQSNLSFWEAAQATNRQDPYIAAMMARSYLEGGKVDQARKEIDASLQSKNDNPIAYLVAGQLKLNAKDYVQAEEMFNKAKDLAQKAGISPLLLREIQLGLAEAEVNLKKFDKARELVMQVLVADRNNVRANLIMGKSLIGLKQPMLALNFLNSGYKADQMNPDYLEPIAEAGLDTGMDNLVRNAYGAARVGLRIAPSENMERIFAQAALETGHYQESDQIIDSLLKRQPANAKYLYLKSCVEKQLNKVKEAEDFRKKAFAIDPTIDKTLQVKILPEVNKPQSGIPKAGK